MRQRSKKIITISLLTLVATYIIVGFFIIAPAIKSNFNRIDMRAYFRAAPIYDDMKAELPRRDITFQSGENTLEGAIYGTGDKGLIVMVHGFGGNMDNFLLMIQFFVEKDWRVFAYDGTGINDSGGESRIGLYQAVHDLRAALDFAYNEPTLNSLPVALFGHSQGGFAVCAVLNYSDARDVKAVVSVAGMDRAGDMVDLQGTDRIGALYWLFKPFVLLTDDGNFGQNAPYTAIDGINKDSASVMLIQGTADTVVPPDRCAITHFADSITNPDVEIIFMSDEWNSSHNNVMWSEDAFNYRMEVNATIPIYNEAHGIEWMTDEDANAWAEEIQMDKARLNALNISLFEQIESFLTNAIDEK